MKVDAMLCVEPRPFVALRITVRGILDIGCVAALFRVRLYYAVVLLRVAGLAMVDIVEWARKRDGTLVRGGAGRVGNIVMAAFLSGGGVVQMRVVMLVADV